MSTESSQQFLRDLDTKLWTGADRLRAISAIPVEHANLHAKAVLGHVLQILPGTVRPPGAEKGHYFMPKTIV